MAIYLRPRRGKKSTAVSQNIILKRGEIFLESPETGVGTGIGKIKVGDGSTAYSSLPYFIDTSALSISDNTITFTESTETTNATLLNAIATGGALKTIIGSIKKMLRNLDSSVTSINSSITSINTALNGKAATSHTQAASTITKGTLPVGVVATNSTDYTVSRLRNIRFGTTAPTSLSNGEIFIVYE